MMSHLIARIPMVYLLPVAIVMALAPFRPEPHLFEKLRMLFGGQLSKPIDIFDLFMHGAPLLLVAVKLLLGRASSREKTKEE